MSKIKVCALFRPLDSKERADYGDSVSIQCVDSKSFMFKHDKEELEFSFDGVFYPGSPQSDVYEVLALPIVQGALSGINGAIIAYGQTGAGKTYSMEGPSIMDGDEKKKGLLPRVVNGLFEAIKFSDETSYSIKLSMVEIYKEKVRDLVDLTKDNIQIKENQQQGIFLSGATEITVANSTEALESLCSAIANRVVGETQMNMASSRSHCIYIFTIQQEITKDRRMKSVKLLLVDLAGSEKVEKTGAEGRVLEEAKTINKSLSALGNVINALTGGFNGKANHVPYRDSKLTRILQDALVNFLFEATSIYCCSTPFRANWFSFCREVIPRQLCYVAAHLVLQMLRRACPPFVLEQDFSVQSGRAKHIKANIHVISPEDICARRHEAKCLNQDELRGRVVEKLRVNFKAEDVDLLEQLFVLEELFFDPSSIEEVEFAYEDLTSRTILLLQKAVEELSAKNEELMKQNMILEAKLRAAEVKGNTSTSYLSRIFGITSKSWIGSVFFAAN